MRGRTFACPWLGGLMVLGVLGCSGSKTVPVKGSVTFDGKPLPNATVRFLPMNEGGRDALGVTDGQGAFHLETYGNKDGALPGDYKVIVEHHEALTESQVPAPQPGQSMKAMWDASQKALKEQAKKAPKFVIPAKYGDRKETVLKQHIPPEGPVLLELRSK